jgi:tripartite ATP-independent transporter DctP family solute receptor
MLKFKRIKLTILLTVILSLLLSMPVLAQIEMRVATNHAGDTPATKGLYYFRDRIAELTEGEIQISVHTGGTLGTEVETMEQLQSGALELNRVCTAHLSVFNPLMDIFSIPFLFRDQEHYLNVIFGGIGRELAATCENSNFKFLVWIYAGSRSFFNNVRPINTPDDLEGLKIRVMASEIMLETIRTLGASPTATAYAEVYSALQTGIIDGAENSPPSVYDMSHYEVAKYYSLDEHMMIPDVIVMNLDEWNKLEPVHKAIFLRVSEETQQYILEEWMKVEEEALEKIKESGTEVNTITDENKLLFIEKVAPLHDKLRGTFAGYIDRMMSVAD